MTRMKQDKEVGIALKKIKSPTGLTINLETFKIPSSYLKLGKEMVMKVSGKITFIHQDEYGKTCSLEIKDMEIEDEDMEGEKDDM